MTSAPSEIDAYLASVDPGFRKALTDMRTAILRELDTRSIGYVERMSYGMPGMQVIPERKMIAGYAAHTHKCGYYPHSGGVVQQLGDALGGRGHTKSAVHFGPDDPMPARLVAKCIDLRLAEIRP